MKCVHSAVIAPTRDNQDKSDHAFAAGQYYCNGSCYPITCQALAVLKASRAPEILLSTEAKGVLSSSLNLVSAYATPVAFNFLPCPSTGMP